MQNAEVKTLRPPQTSAITRGTVAMAMMLACLFALAQAARAETADAKCVPSTAANEVTPPPPTWVLAHQPRPADLPRALCPAGEAPASPGRAGPVNARPPLTQSPRGAGTAQPAFVAPIGATAPYYYAGDGWRWTSYAGESVNIGIGSPTISAGAHSLGQLSVATPSVNFSVELGWHVDPAFGSGPRLFSYINKDHYATNGQPGGDCYNCGLVTAAGAAFSLNQLLVPGISLQFGILYNGGNWWISVGNSWIGYFPGSFWGGAFTSSTWLSAFGEVYDTSGPNSEMGNGIFGSTAGSLVMNNPLMYPDATTTVTVAGHPTASDNPYPSSQPNYTV
ncbi:MAG TPA: hypothetical protein VNT55_14795, partial [Baekduia sp.]|nr:hypothetical protein [Baekduia sp.]